MDKEKWKEAAEALKENQYEMREPLEVLPKPPESSKIAPGPKVHFQYYEPAEGTGGLPAMICTCGSKKHHVRKKVLAVWSKNHFYKTGHDIKKEKEDAKDPDTVQA